MNKYIASLVLILISAPVYAENYRFSLNAGDLISNTYNYATGNSQGNPTIFDSNQTRRAKEAKIKAEERARIQAEKKASKIASQGIKKAELNAFEKGLMKPITKQGLAQGAKIAGGAYLAKSGVGHIAKHTLAAGTIIGVGGAAIDIGEDIEYQNLISSPLYKELYNEISAKASIIDDQLYEQDKKYRLCNKKMAFSYLTVDKNIFDYSINNVYLITLQINNIINPLFNVNSYFKNQKNYKEYKKQNKKLNIINIFQDQDHIPSKASIIKYFGTLNSMQENNLVQNTTTIDITHIWHKNASLSYLYNNTKKRIESDSKNLRDATFKDIAALGYYINQDTGYLDKISYLKSSMILYKRNSKLCLYSR